MVSRSAIRVAGSDGLGLLGGELGAVEVGIRAAAREQVVVGAVLGDPAVLSDQQEYQKIAKQRADLEEVVTRFRELRDIERQIAEAREMMDSDPEMREIAREEYDRLQEQLPEAQSQLKLLLLPKDPNDDKNVIVEVRSYRSGEGRPPRETLSRDKQRRLRRQISFLRPL